MTPADKTGEALTAERHVRKTTGDYIFEGVVRGIINKRDGQKRLVVEDDRGLLLILNEKQVIDVPAEVLSRPPSPPETDVRLWASSLRHDGPWDEDEPKTDQALARDIDQAADLIDRLAAEAAAAKRERDGFKIVVERAINHCEPAFIQTLANERETWIADNMRFEILARLRELNLVGDYNAYFIAIEQRAETAEASLSEANQRCSELQRLYTNAAEVVAIAQEDVSRLQAERDGAWEALKPFARIKPSSFYATDGSEGEEYSVFLTDVKGIFTGKDLARARDALKRPNTEAKT